MTSSTTPRPFCVRRVTSPKGKVYEYTDVNTTPTRLALMEKCARMSADQLAEAYTLATSDAELKIIAHYMERSK